MPSITKKWPYGPFKLPAFAVFCLLLVNFSDFALANNEACELALASGHKFDQEALRNIRLKKIAQRKAFYPLIEEFANVVRSGISQVPKLTEEEANNVRMSNINPQSETHAVEKLVLNSKRILVRTEPTAALDDYKRLNSNHEEYVRLLGNNRYRSNVYLWRNFHSDGEPKSVFEYVPTVVGLNPPIEYFKLIVTTSVILRMIEKNNVVLKPIAESIDESDVRFGRKDVGILDSGGSITSGDYTILALIEGVVSLHQYIGFLIGSPIEGPPPPVVINQLLEPDETDRTLMTRLTQMLPLALVGPFTLKGYFFLHPFGVTDANKIVPSDKFINFLKKGREHGIPYVNSNRGNSHSTCTGCPMVGSGNENRRGGIDLLSEAYLSIYREVSGLVDR